MKNVLRLLFLCLWFVPQLLSAKHILGGDMAYYYTQNGQLNIEIMLYRDCGNGGALFDNPAEIAIYKPTGELFSSFNVPLDSFKTVNPDLNACIVPNQICVERGFYTFPLSLPDDGNTYLVVYQRCCRANDITNIVNPAEVGYTLNLEITALARLLKNNSPRWMTTPSFNICVHEATELNLAATETEGDILLYSFCTPLSGGGDIVSGTDLLSCIGAQPTPPCPPPFQQVQFAVPNYTLNNPLGSVASQLDPVSGHWSITPDYLGKFNYAVCVHEYRNGTLLSTLQRDLTIWVEDLVGTKETGNFATIACSPNPAGNTVFISTELFEGKNIQIELADLAGKIWMAEKRENTAATEQLDLGPLPAGIYQVKILAAGKTALGRFVHL